MAFDNRYGSPPILKIQLEGMKHVLMNHLETHHQEIENMVKTEMDKVIQDFDYAEIVSEATQAAVRSSIERAIANFFKHGDGYKTINAEVHKILKDTLAGGT